ncbi:MAG: DNA primase [Prevotella sp.]|nr:DNA primase [Prevotella sp.]
MIDHLTVEKIKEAANIVDVVSEFVTLKKSGSNYKGLCPFHNEKTPSFYVSPARGTCHCFGCGKGGNSIGFIMEHEQMTYPEALRWLANKYHIEIHERELTDREKEEQSRRESMFIINEWARDYFENLLHNHADGKAIGMQYFRMRGFRDDVIRKFNLGFDLADRYALGREAQAKGYREDYLTATGICYKNDRGELIDRYAGRVVFPWTGVSGKVVGFTARVLDSRTKGVSQKYVNSPDSEIFHKDHELYGIWQAKKAIAREDRVFMVEGQADVIAMYQCGVENVVANSGTALSLHQIHMLHRFTSNITLLYDSDAAGIHAALRGTDMLLSEGMNLKVLLLPEGKDPDEFARTHTADEFSEYIETHQVDFIQFKTDLLLKNETDPKKRADAINSIVESISVIQNQILRDTYIHDCAQRIGISEATLINQMNSFIRDRRSRTTAQPPQPAAGTPEDGTGMAVMPQEPDLGQQASKVECLLLQMVVRHGEHIIMRGVEDDSGQLHDVSVAQYISYNLAADKLTFSSPLFNRMLDEAVEKSGEAGFKAETWFLHHNDIDVSRLATALATEEYHLTPRHTDGPQNEEAERQREANETEALRMQVDHLLTDIRMDYVERHLKELQVQMAQAASDMEKLKTLMADYRDMQNMRNQLARKLGSNIIV